MKKFLKNLFTDDQNKPNNHTNQNSNSYLSSVPFSNLQQSNSDPFNPRHSTLCPSDLYNTNGSQLHSVNTNSNLINPPHNDTISLSQSYVSNSNGSLSSLSSYPNQLIIQQTPIQQTQYNEQPKHPIYLGKPHQGSSNAGPQYLSGCDEQIKIYNRWT
jgi:hypothetical protein